MTRGVSLGKKSLPNIGVIRSCLIWVGLLAVVPAILQFALFANASDTSSTKIQTITLWDYTGHAAKLTQTLVDEFNAGLGAEKHIHVVFSNHGRNFNHDLEMAMDLGNPPDIFPSREGLFNAFLQKQRLLPIEDMPGGKQFLSKYRAHQLTPGVHILQDKTYSVPSKIFTFKLLYNKALFLRADLKDKQGNPTPPKTWDEFRAFAKRISDLEPGKTFGLILPMKGSSQGEYPFFWEYKAVRPFSSSFGRLYFDNVQGRYNFAVYKPMLEMMRALKTDGSIFPGEKAISDDSARIRFGRKGNVGMYIAASWDVGVLNEQYPARIDWGVADIPVLDTRRRYKTVIVSDYGYNISKAAGNKDRRSVMEVYKFLHSQQWLARLYEDAKHLPMDPAVYRSVKPPTQKGWAAFADPNNVVSAPDPNNLLRVKGPKWYQIFQLIYDGQLDMDEALEKLSVSYNNALTRAVKNGIVDLEKYRMLPSEFQH